MSGRSPCGREISPTPGPFAIARFAHARHPSVRRAAPFSKHLKRLPARRASAHIELPHAFRTTVDTIPPPLLDMAHQRMPGDGRARVGLVWTSGNWDPERNVPFEVLQELLQCDVHWILLQDGATSAERRLFDCTAPIETISTLAEAMRSCDLVITVDTMAAHLAGSLGVPTWTLLRHRADWRWLSDRCDSPWYPTMRLYRQPAHGSWIRVLREVTSDLNAIATTDWRDRPAAITARPV